MNDKIHLLLATTVSMLITWTLNSIFSTRRESSSSIFQQFFVDRIDDGFLIMQCFFIEQQDAKECGHILLKEDKVKMDTFLIYQPMIFLLAVFYGSQGFIRIRSVAFTIVVVSLLNRYFTDHQLENPLDLFTVYLLVWQFVLLICRWESHDLWWPALILQQASLSFFIAFIAFIMYDALFHHLPIQFHFTVLWFRALLDIFECLHPRGHLREKFKALGNSLSAGNPTYPSGVYYPREYQTNDTRFSALGLGDFLIYNLMVLLPSFPLASMSTRLSILCGSIVSIHIGNVGTLALERFWERNSMPGLPFPVVTFSAYTLFLNAIMRH